MREAHVSSVVKAIRQTHDTETETRLRTSSGRGGSRVPGLSKIRTHFRPDSSRKETIPGDDQQQESAVMMKTFSRKPQFT